MSHIGFPTMIKILLSDLQVVSAKRPAGYYDEVVSSGKVETAEILILDDAIYLELQKKYSPQPITAVQQGPGTELKKLLSKLGLKPTANCKCAQHIQEMNLKGPDWCEQNIDTIVGWLREEADRAKMPFTAVGAKIIVKRSISKAKKMVA
jgi:hypothetical protein